MVRIWLCRRLAVVSPENAQMIPVVLIGGRTEGNPLSRRAMQEVDPGGRTSPSYGETGRNRGRSPVLHDHLMFCRFRIGAGPREVSPARGNKPHRGPANRPCAEISGFIFRYIPLAMIRAAPAGGRAKQAAGVNGHGSHRDARSGSGATRGSVLDPLD